MGTIGNAAVIEDYVLPANMDRHLGIIRINDNLVDSYYLSAFLNCEFGKFQTLRESTGNVQLNLFIEKIKTLLVPVGENFDAIGELMRVGSDKRKESERLYAEAEGLLLEALGLDGLDLSPQLSYTATFDEVGEDFRLDAEYFQPQYKRAYEAIKALNPIAITPLGELLTTLTNGHTPRRHNLSIGNITFLTAEHVLDFRIDYDSSKRIEKEHHENLLSRTRLRNGDMLITIKGRIGNVAIVEGLNKPTNINQDVALLRLKEGYHPYYIAGFLNSLAGKALVEKASTGQINPFLRLGSLKQIPIPSFEKSRMDELGEQVKSTVTQAYKAQEKAQQLLETAKQRVEQMILYAA